MKGNTISLRGNITRDVEERVTNGGSTVLEFGVAWNKPRRNRDGSYSDIANYFDVKCWVTDAQGRVLKPGLVKGAPIAIIDGHIEQDRWEDKGGNKRSKVVILVDDPICGIVVGQKSNSGRGSTYGANKAPAAPPPSAPSQAPDPAPAPIVTPTSDAYEEEIPF